ncbi:MAG: transcriptional regulator [Gammaproteobacteria bacterium]
MNDATLTLEQNKAALQAKATPVRRKASRGSRFEQIGAMLFFGGVLITLYRGWLDRNDLSRTAESGIGYALGIIGGVLMLMLLLYPLRKRARFMQRLGPVKWWFRSHMILGIVGPMCILFHCSFHPGALNSNVSLLCMVLVASSGLVGRYLYSKIHYGLYGRKATLQELLQDSSLFKSLLETAFTYAPNHRDRLQAVEKDALSRQRGMLSSILNITIFTIQSYWIGLSLRRLLKRALANEMQKHAGHRREFKEKLREQRRQLAEYLATLRKINQLSFYDRLFSMWHVLHFPLFLMLVISGIAHVIAVHLY